jgi:integrase
MGQAYESKGFVCCWEDGKPFDPEWVDKKWRLLAEFEPLIPYNVRFHDLRHTHAPILLSQGLNLKIVQERLGHESIATTGDIYSHVTPGMQQQAISILETLFITAEIDDQQVCVANVSEK